MWVIPYKHCMNIGNIINGRDKLSVRHAIHPQINGRQNTGQSNTNAMQS
jgi:hypothetical protein